MSYQLDFKISYRYNTLKGGISIPATLTIGDRSVDCEAKVDPGAEYCLFQREIADRLSVDLEFGHFLRMGTLTGSLPTYGHEVTLQTFDYAFDVMVYFAEDYGVARNLLGRHGWLQLLQLGLRDYDEILYLNSYDAAQ
jgi:hypothetical protein